MTSDEVRRADVSVVVAHHDDATHLARALDSVARQTWPVREIIVVDDASEPAQREAAQREVDRVPGALLIRMTRNQGPATARNMGWDRARGAWVAFLDSDEVWHRDKVALQLTAAGTPGRPPALIASGVAQLHPDDAAEVFATSSVTLPAVRRVGRRQLLVRNPFPTSSVMVRCDMVSRFTPGMRHCEDYDLFLRIAREDDSMLKLDAPLVARFKYPFGHSGLSANVTAMMRGEVASFARARRHGDVSALEWAFAAAVMVVRFARQALLHRVRSRRGYPTA